MGIKDDYEYLQTLDFAISELNKQLQEVSRNVNKMFLDLECKKAHINILNLKEKDYFEYKKLEQEYQSLLLYKQDILDRLHKLQEERIKFILRSE